MPRESLEPAGGNRADDLPIIPVILCGGSGVRLWPLSRPNVPKQMLALAGPEPLLVSTVRRLDGIVSRPSIIVCGRDQHFLTGEILARAGHEIGVFIQEPVARNTAPAIAAAALVAFSLSPSAILIVQPSDHAIADLAAFQTTIKDACRVAADGRKLVVLGVPPRHPETGFGYIERGEPIVGHGAFTVRRFVEKPDRDRAAEMLRSGSWFWNAGIFVFSAATILEELAALRPDILAACRAALERATREGTAYILDRDSFAAAEAISIDHAVMEKSRHLAVVPLAAGWSDIGSWEALWESGQRDAAGNVVQGDVVCMDSRDSYLRSEGRLLACIGLEKTVVVATGDAVLVADRAHGQQVRQLVEQLQAGKRREGLESRLVVRPWGTYEVLAAGIGFQVKHIVVRPGARLSLQMHHKRAEHWVVVRGSALVQVGEEERRVEENESVVVPLGAKHRLANAGESPLEVIEVQCGVYLGEDDIVRFEDAYGRVG